MQNKTTDDAAKKNFLRIAEAAKAAGVSRQSLEYYILVGLVNPIRSGPRGGRRFDADLVRRIRLIRQLNESGYTLRDIREIYLQQREK